MIYLILFHFKYYKRKLVDWMIQLNAAKFIRIEGQMWREWRWVCLTVSESSELTNVRQCRNEDNTDDDVLAGVCVFCVADSSDRRQPFVVNSELRNNLIHWLSYHCAISPKKASTRDFAYINDYNSTFLVIIMGNTNHRNYFRLTFLKWNTTGRTSLRFSWKEAH